MRPSGFSFRSGRTDRQSPYIGEPYEKCLYVNGIPSDWDEWRVFNIFRHFGTVNKIKLTKSTETQPYGFCFVDMMTLEDIDSVLDGLSQNRYLTVDGLEHALDVELVRPKEKYKTSRGYATDLVLAQVNDEKIQSTEPDNHMATQKIDGSGYYCRKNLRRKRFLSEESGDVSIWNADSKQVRKVNNFGAIYFDAAIHRFRDIALGELAPVDVVVSYSGIHNSPPVFHALLRRDSIDEDKYLKEMMEQNFISAGPLKFVKEFELVIVKDELEGDDTTSSISESKSANECNLMRGIVNEVHNENEVTVFGVDTAKHLKVSLANIRRTTSAVTKPLFKAIPCLFYGLSLPLGITDEYDKFADEVVSKLQWANRNASLAIRLVSFDGFFNVVQLFITEKRGGKSMTYDFIQSLAESGICSYSSPRKQRIVYSRIEILSWNRSHGEVPKLIDGLEEAIGISSE